MTWQRSVFSTMGTVASLTFDADIPNGVDLRPVHEIFADFDERYSLYKPQSELSRIASHELELSNASEGLRDTYALALEWRAATRGEFTPHRPDGVIDLSGVVKALAMERAGEVLVTSGATNWCLNVGGDVLVSGLGEKSEPWSVGIVDPLDRSRLLTSVTLRDDRRACATSGGAERGDHIWTVGAASAQFVQATVLANDIVTADVLATTIIAGGPTALDHICRAWDIDAMTIDQEGELRMTPNFTTRISSDR